MYFIVSHEYTEHLESNILDAYMFSAILLGRMSSKVSTFEHLTGSIAYNLLGV